jgi:hypothetical protein
MPVLKYKNQNIQLKNVGLYNICSELLRIQNQTAETPAIINPLRVQTQILLDNSQAGATGAALEARRTARKTAYENILLIIHNHQNTNHQNPEFKKEVDELMKVSGADYAAIRPFLEEFVHIPAPVIIAAPPVVDVVMEEEEERVAAPFIQYPQPSAPPAAAVMANMQRQQELADAEFAEKLQREQLELEDAELAAQLNADYLKQQREIEAAKQQRARATEAAEAVRLQQLAHDEELAIRLHQEEQANLEQRAPVARTAVAELDELLAAQLRQEELEQPVAHERRQEVNLHEQPQQQAVNAYNRRQDRCAMLSNGLYNVAVYGGNFAVNTLYPIAMQGMAATPGILFGLYNHAMGYAAPVNAIAEEEQRQDQAPANHAHVAPANVEEEEQQIKRAIAASLRGD